MNIKKKKGRSYGDKMSRRRFVGGSFTVLAGAGLIGPDKLLGYDVPSVDEDFKVKEYRTLGKTGFKCSDIGFGTGELTDPALLEAILDAGVNYIDTAESYSRGQTERLIGDVVKKRDRKSVFITTKMGLSREKAKEKIKERMLKCLERLQTDYIDCMQIHSASTVEQLKNEGYHAAIRELKAEGKVRFSGISNHGPQWQAASKTMEKVHLAAAEDGRFDVNLLAYNFIQKEMGEKILKAYKEKNIGATLMKTNPVLNYMEKKEDAERMKAEGKEVPERFQKMVEWLKIRADKAEGFKKKYNLTKYEEIRDAAIKFALSNPDMNCACITIKNFSDLEVYMKLSGKRLSLEEGKKLALYESIFGEFYCRHACGECESKCPNGVPVNTIMRYNHYFRAQGREKTAMVKYTSLHGKKAGLCSSCAGYCERACSYGVPIQSLLMLAHRTLTLV
ncbi:aldo/keto reductase [Acidobacteriota bacterium]